MPKQALYQKINSVWYIICASLIICASVETETVVQKWVPTGSHALLSTSSGRRGTTTDAIPFEVLCLRFYFIGAGMILFLGLRDPYGDGARFMELQKASVSW